MANKRCDSARPFPQTGVYIALFRLSRPRRISVGRLGIIAFAAGMYAYVGSAQRNVQARLDRHARRRKPMRWHIDYLSVRAEMIGAIVIEGPKSLECRLAAALARNGGEPVGGFGCTDCRCRSHLFRVMLRGAGLSSAERSGLWNSCGLSSLVWSRGGSRGCL